MKVMNPGNLDSPGVSLYSVAMKVSLTAHQASFINKKMKTGGYRSRSEIVSEALRVYELVEEEDYEPDLEAALRQSLRGPVKKYTKNHFANLAFGGRKQRAA